MADTADSSPLLEIRTYRLKAGTTEGFHATMGERGAPLLREFGVDVVRYGPSEMNEEGVEEYVLMRSFESHDARDEQEKRFYTSPEWLDGPRGGIVERIESYHTIVLSVPAAAVDALRS
ncbi:MAG: NIPSNAP family protein [Pseudonocardiales bacterium]|nr:MAG: NIPSNAP family protein [Pseudonocardiales bacterium]